MGKTSIKKKKTKTQEQQALTKHKHLARPSFSCQTIPSGQVFQNATDASLGPVLTAQKPTVGCKPTAVLKTH